MILGCIAKVLNFSKLGFCCFWDNLSSVIKPCNLLQFPTVKEVRSSCIQVEEKGVHISGMAEEPLRIEIRMHMATG